MIWIEGHRLSIGILADSLTFLGGLILTRDAFLRLRDLKKNRVDLRFRAEFPRIHLTDEEWKAAVISVRWTLTGFVLILLGFFFQLLLRLIEAN
jgi:hypothetical protein